MTSIWHPSPNFGERRGVESPDMIVLHYTAMSCAARAREWLCNPVSQVSAHYVISETGTVWQLVEEDKRAWHAGAGVWGRCRDVNSRSIGIEIANTGVQPFSEPQMTALESILRSAMARWTIPAYNIIGHSDMALGRKVDPGPRFDWRRLALQDLAVWPEQVRQTGNVSMFYRYAETVGYRWLAGQEDILLNAVRLRFAPWRTGPLCAEDAADLRCIADRWPADQAPV